MLSLVLRQGGRVVAAGVLLGLTMTLAIARSIGALLFAVTPHDPLTLLSCSTMLFAVALAAMVVPARSATRVDPAVAMRCD